MPTMHSSVDPLSKYSRLTKVTRPARLNKGMVEKDKIHNEQQGNRKLEDKSIPPLNFPDRDLHSKYDMSKSNAKEKLTSEQNEKKRKINIDFNGGKSDKDHERKVDRKIQKSEPSSIRPIKNEKKIENVATKQQEVLFDRLDMLKKRRLERVRMEKEIVGTTPLTNLNRVNNKNRLKNTHRLNYDENANPNSQSVTSQTPMKNMTQMSSQIQFISREKSSNHQLNNLNDQNDSNFSNLSSASQFSIHPTRSDFTPMSNNVPSTFSQEWIDKKQRLLRKRAKRERNKQLAMEVIQHWKRKAASRICRLRARKFFRQRLLSFAFFAWRSVVFVLDHNFRSVDNIFDSTTSQQYFQMKEVQKKPEQNLQKIANIRKLEIGRSFESQKSHSSFLNTSPQNLNNQVSQGRVDPYSGLINPATYQSKLYKGSLHFGASIDIPNQSPYWQQHFIVATRHDFLLKQKVLQLWIRKTHLQQIERKNEQRKFSLATNHYIKYLVESSFRRWQFSIQRTHEKQKNNEKAYMFLYSMSLKKALNAWKSFIQIKKKKQQLKLVADDMYYTNLIRATLRHFRFVLQELYVYRQNVEKMEQFYIFCLKKKTMQAFKNLLIFKAEKLKKMKLVEEFQLISCRRLYFRTWLIAAENRKKMRKREKYEKAEHFYNRQIQKRILLQWINYTRQSILKKFHKKQADSFWIQKNAFEILDYLKMKANVKRCHRIMNEKADSHYQKKLKENFFHMLLLYIHNENCRRENMSKADDLFKAKILKRAFMQWIQRVNAILEVENQIENAREYYLIRLKHTMLRLWKQVVDTKRTHYENKMIADDFHSYQIQRRAILIWQQQVKDLQEQVKKYNQALSFHNRSILAHHWRSWINYIEYRREKEKLIQATILNIQAKLHASKRKRILKQWYDWYQKQIRKRIYLQRAEDYYQICLMRQMIDAWKNFVLQRKRRKAQKILSQNFLEYQRKECAFSVLKYAFSIEQDIHKKEMKALKYHDSLLQKEYFKKWKQFIKERKIYEMKKLEAIQMRQEFLKMMALRRIASATRIHREERLPFLRNPEIDPAVLQSYEVLVKYFRRWRICLSEKEKRSTWNLPRRGKPKQLLPVSDNSSFEEKIKNIDPRPEIDKLLVKPLIERPRPRLPSTLLSEAIKEGRSAKSLLQSTAIVHNNVDTELFSLVQNTVRLQPDSGPFSSYQHDHLNNDFENESIILHDEFLEPPSGIQSNISLSDLQNNPFQPENNSSYQHAESQKRINEREQIQKEIEKIHEAVQGILILKDQYKKDKNKLQQLAREIQEFPFHTESAEYQNMVSTSKILEEKVNRFEQLKQLKLPQLQEVLQRKIISLRELA